MSDKIDFKRIADAALGRAEQLLGEWLPHGHKAGGEWQIVDLDPDVIEANRAAAEKDALARYEKALDDHLDGVAQRYRFADRKTLALRAGYPSAYHDLGLAYATWMDGCNVLAYQILQNVLDGSVALPSVEGFLAELPVFDWGA